MGKEIEKIALSRGHEIVSIIDIDNTQDFESEAFRSADVAIEFTAPSVAYNNCLSAFKNGVKVVSGSTGWMNEHADEMRRMCTEEGATLFWSSNFSLGVAIFSAVNKYLARIMNNFPGYEMYQWWKLIIFTSLTLQAVLPSLWPKVFLRTSTVRTNG